MTIRRKYFSATLLLAGLFVAPAHAADTLSGIWAMNGGAQPICTFAQTGSTLSGTCTGPASRGSVQGPLSGSVDAKAVKLSWNGAEFAGQWDLKDSITGQLARDTGPQAGTLLPFVAVRLPALPKTLSVTNANGEKLEVMDWGGSGKPVLIIPGEGGQAESVSVLGGILAGNHHAYSFTPIGDRVNGASAGDNVVAVMDGLKLAKPVLVGHSLACEELSSVASRFPEKIAGLIYLDACLYKSGSPDQQKWAAEKFPIIKTPILAMFGGPAPGAAAERPVPRPVGEQMPSFDDVVAGFRARQPKARVVRLPGASHFLWITNQADVAREMNAFLRKLPG